VDQYPKKWEDRREEEDEEGAVPLALERRGEGGWQSWVVPRDGGRAGGRKGGKDVEMGEVKKEDRQ